MVVDVHCHMFNGDDLPIRGFAARVALHKKDSGGVLVNLVDKYVQGRAPGYFTDRDRLIALVRSAGSGEESVLAEPEGIDALVAREFATLQATDPTQLAEISRAVAVQDRDSDDLAMEGEEGFSPADVVRAIKWAMLFGRSRADLPADYRASVGADVGLAVAMMVDLDLGVVDHAQTTGRQQIELAELVSRASMLDVLPGVSGLRVHHFAAFDPLRELQARNAGLPEKPLDVVKDAVMRFGCVGVKVYPQMGWRPSGNAARPGLTAGDADVLNAIVDDLAGWCAAEDVPITAHCNDSNYSNDTYAGFGQPEQWFPLLESHPGLHLNLGHSGGAYPLPNDYTWGHQLLTGMATYEHLYGDVGCHRVDQDDTLDGFIDVVRQADAAGRPVLDRLMFGTDWYMNALNPDAGDFLGTYRDRFSAAFGSPSTERFMTTNALDFLGLRAPTKNAQRLRARYDSFQVPHPDWLRP